MIPSCGWHTTVVLENLFNLHQTCLDIVHPLYNPKNGQMRIAGLMSGSGSNLRKILEKEKELERDRGASPYRVAVIFSDAIDSNAVEIGKAYGIPVVINDIREFYKARGKPRGDMQVRAEYDLKTVSLLSPFGISVAAYAGYMSIATAPLVDAFLGVNVHPADLSVLENGSRKYVGDHAVLDCLRVGEKELRSSTHIIENEVDGGRLLMISAPVKVEQEVIPELFDEFAQTYQARLKEKGDWVIFPETLLHLAEGRYAADETGLLHFDGKPIPYGVRLDE